MLVLWSKSLRVIALSYYIKGDSRHPYFKKEVAPVFSEECDNVSVCVRPALRMTAESNPLGDLGRRYSHFWILTKLGHELGAHSLNIVKTEAVLELLRGKK